MNIIENNRVVVIKGATGSGKTTRVPQLLLDNYIKQNRGVDCNIAISQPRRISATSLAARIASERNENVCYIKCLLYDFYIFLKRYVFSVRFQCRTSRSIQSYLSS